MVLTDAHMSRLAEWLTRDVREWHSGPMLSPTSLLTLDVLEEKEFILPNERFARTSRKKP